MARKPIELEVSGMLTPRERLWAAARKLREFTLVEWQDATKPVVRLDTCETYLRSLVKAGHVVATEPPKLASSRKGFAQSRYRVAKDTLDAPRVGRDGAKVVQGGATLAMWRAMRVLKSFDYHDIQRAASMPAGLGNQVLVVSPQTAKTYVSLLARAGYFKLLTAAKPGTAARYRLANYTGAHAPAVTRRKTVFDRNTGNFMWQESAQEVVDALE
ncbi:MAG: hypothetical protein AB7P37_21180 [Ramlibacter sp.]